MNDLLNALILGIVEGLTEFIPVSSTGHLILAGELLNFTGEKEATFSVVIQLGAILAVLFLYHERFSHLLSPFFKNENENKFKAWFGSEGLTLLNITIAISPALLLGYLLHSTIKNDLFGSETVVIGLIIGGVIMIIIDFKKPATKIDVLDKVGMTQALWVGIGQCFSLWPGVSRSGATIISGILSGMSQKVAAEFSFIIAVPVMIAATGYDFLKTYHLFTSDDLVFLLVGFLVSFIVAILAIKWFLSVLAKLNLAPFGIYRILVGVVYYLVFLR